MPDEISKPEVKRRKRRLIADYGDVPTLKETETVPAAEFPSLRDEFVENGYFGGAGALVTKGTDVLLVTESPKRDAWGAPYGGHEGDETLEETARREVKEETGIACTLTGLLQLWHLTWVSDGEHDARIHQLGAFFEADWESGEISVDDPSDEVVAARWFSRPPETVHHTVEDPVREWFEDG